MVVPAENPELGSKWTYVTPQLFAVGNEEKKTKVINKQLFAFLQYVIKQNNKFYNSIVDNNSLCPVDIRTFITVDESIGTKEFKAIMQALK